MLYLSDSKVKARCISCSPSSNGKEVRRRVWRVVGVGIGLLRHDGEVEGVVVKDDAVLEFCIRGRVLGCRVPEPHRPPRQLPQPPRRGAAAPSRPQLCVVHGGAPRCRRLEDQPWRVIVAIPGARSSMQPLVLLAVRHFNSRSS